MVWTFYFDIDFDIDLDIDLDIDWKKALRLPASKLCLKTRNA
jgi:hypothetical protein